MGENGLKICLSNSSAMLYYHLLNCMKLTYSRSAFIFICIMLLRRHSMANNCCRKKSFPFYFFVVYNFIVVETLTIVVFKFNFA